MGTRGPLRLMSKDVKAEILGDVFVKEDCRNKKLTQLYVRHLGRPTDGDQEQGEGAAKRGW